MQWWNPNLWVLFLSVYVMCSIKSKSPWYPSSFQLKKIVSTIYLATLTIASSSSSTTWLPGILQDKFFTTVIFFFPLRCFLQSLKNLLLLQLPRLGLLHLLELRITEYTLYLYMPVWEKSIFVLKRWNQCCRRSVHISRCCRALPSWWRFNKTWHRYGAKIAYIYAKRFSWEKKAE